MCVYACRFSSSKLSDRVNNDITRNADMVALVKRVAVNERSEVLSVDSDLNISTHFELFKIVDEGNRNKDACFYLELMRLDQNKQVKVHALVERKSSGVSLLMAPVAILSVGAHNNCIVESGVEMQVDVAWCVA